MTPADFGTSNDEIKLDQPSSLSQHLAPSTRDAYVEWFIDVCMARPYCVHAGTGMHRFAYRPRMDMSEAEESAFMSAVSSTLDVRFVSGGYDRQSGVLNVTVELLNFNKWAQKSVPANTWDKNYMIQAAEFSERMKRFLKKQIDNTRQWAISRFRKDFVLAGRGPEGPLVHILPFRVCTGTPLHTEFRSKPLSDILRDDAGVYLRPGAIDTRSSWNQTATCSTHKSQYVVGELEIRSVVTPDVYADYMKRIHDDVSAEIKCRLSSVDWRQPSIPLLAVNWPTSFSAKEQEETRAAIVKFLDGKRGVHCDRVGSSLTISIY